MSAARSTSAGSTRTNSFGAISKLIRFLLSRGLLAEGLFTLAPTDPEVNNIRKRLTAESDDVDLSTWTRSAPGVSVLLLEYLRGLPEPLLTFDRYDSFLMTEYIKDPNERIKYRKMLIDSLPPAYLNAATQLLTLLNRLKNNEISNHISISFLAPLFGPIFLRASYELPFNKEDGPRVHQLISDLIMDYNSLFPDGEVKSKNPVTPHQRSLIREDTPPSSPRVRARKKSTGSKQASAVGIAPSPYIIVMSGGKSARKKHVRQSSIEISRRSSRPNLAASADDTPSLDESTLDEDEDEDDLDAEFGDDETANESSSQHAHIILEAASAPIANAPSSQPVEVSKYPSEILSKPIS